MNITHPNFLFGYIAGMSFTLLFLVIIGALHSHDPNPSIRRVRETQYGTNTYLILDSIERNMFEKGDTVLFDGKTHKHDVFAYDASKVVIIK